jgi:hypothetical protein
MPTKRRIALSRKIGRKVDGREMDIVGQPEGNKHRS